MTVRLLRPAAALLVAATALVTTGEIFWRRGGATAFEQDSTRLYETAATVNGRDGRLEVRAAKADLGTTLAQAAAAVGRPVPAEEPGTAYQFVSVENGALVNRFVLPPGLDGTAACLVLSRAAGPARPAWPAAMPRFAGGTPSFAAELDATRASFVSSETALDPAAALDEAAAAYAGEGWTEVTPVQTASFRMFVKGRAQAAVTASRKDGTTRIAAIQRLGSRLGF